MKKRLFLIFLASVRVYISLDRKADVALLTMRLCIFALRPMEGALKIDFCTLIGYLITMSDHHVKSNVDTDSTFTVHYEYIKQKS